ncbi:YGGT domain-containing protein, partial [Cephalotus follicularis]
RFRFPIRRNPNHGHQVSRSGICFSLRVTASLDMERLTSDATILGIPSDVFAITMNIEWDRQGTLEAASSFILLAGLEPPTAKLAISILGPFLSAFAFLFILRIVMSWYPKLPVGKFPYVIAYAPTEPLLVPTRKLIPPLGGVDVTPVVWFGLVSFLNEILLGPQGILVLVSQQVSQ